LRPPLPRTLRTTPNQGAAIGDVFVSSATLNNDRRIPLPGFDAYGLGHTVCAPTPALQAALGLKTGVVSSGNSLDYTDRCMGIMEAHGVAVKEMEGAAIAWVACQLFRVPMFCVKAVTDIVDGGRPATNSSTRGGGAAGHATAGAGVRGGQGAGGSVRLRGEREALAGGSGTSGGAHRPTARV